MKKTYGNIVICVNRTDTIADVYNRCYNNWMETKDKLFKDGIEIEKPQIRIHIPSEISIDPFTYVETVNFGPQRIGYNQVVVEWFAKEKTVGLKSFKN